MHYYFQCKIGWFHLECVGLIAAPEGEWYCSDCIVSRENPIISEALPANMNTNTGEDNTPKDNEKT